MITGCCSPVFFIACQLQQLRAASAVETADIRFTLTLKQDNKWGTPEPNHLIKIHHQ
jgi:hypothetical protein